MKFQTKSDICSLGLIIALALVSQTWAQTPEIQGVTGLEVQNSTGYLAIRVEVPESSALDGVLWYNNDQEVVFPQLLVGIGYENQPGLVSDAVQVKEQVSGLSSAWSQVGFDLPVGATLGGLYVIFRFPETPFVSEGTGGGPAIGYSSSGQGSIGWISGDGESWVALHEDFGFSIVPQFIPYEEGMALKSIGGDDQIVVTDDEVVQMYMKCGPNPFNPRIEIKFGLPQATDVRLDVFDLRGHRIARLVDGPLARGHHTIYWSGKDGSGRDSSSGVYFLKMSANAQSFTRRITLVR